jgi:general secretion pathway protein D
MKAPATMLMASLLLPLLAAAQESASRPAAALAREPPIIPLHELVARVHKKTGRQFVLDPAANVMVMTPGLDADRVDYDLLLVILRSNGLVARADKELVVITPEASARQLPTPIYTADDAKVRDDAVITRVLQVRNACAMHMVPVLRPLMPQFAHLAAYAGTNTLIIVDHADNVRRIADVAGKLDQAATSRQDCGDAK